MSANLYETDFDAWTLHQSQLLRAGDYKTIDRANLAEEIESLGKQQRQDLENRLAILLGHFFQWDHQSGYRCKSWKATICEQRRAIQKLLQQNPSFKPHLAAAMTDVYESGLDLVVRETPLDYPDLPANCAYTPEQLFDSNFPEGLYTAPFLQNRKKSPTRRQGIEV